ncbi:UNVERIFIED_CONTAM: hypothetical protein HDU68_005563 [Siphonaria sp. JEL0065]|nr:hypothetical protein HDU68_005563 [Siphonaria sp. JEL0065]
MPAAIASYPITTATTTLAHKNLVAPSLLASNPTISLSNAYAPKSLPIDSHLHSHSIHSQSLPTTHDLAGPITDALLSLLRMLWGWIASMSMAILLKLIRLGPIPKHVAFIMDGNRRFAKKRGLEVSKGHAEGADTLEETLDWCLKLGVKTVTVYAFSTENFSRNKEKEVDPIMKISTEKFQKFATHSELVKKHDIAVRVHGRLNLLPEPVLKAAHLATKMTCKNSNATLNICMPYTSREEIAFAVKTLVRGVEDGVLEVDDIGEEVLEQCFWTGGLGRGVGEQEGVGGGDLDILVRTSGEVRLSDYMLWQASSSCQIHFLSVYWPDFTFWHMLPALLQYQSNYLSLSKARREHQKRAGFMLNKDINISNSNTKASSKQLDYEKMQLRVKRVREFLESVREQRLAEATAHAE